MNGMNNVTRWLGLVEYAWELFLGVVAFLAVTDVSYFAPGTMLGLYITGTVVVTALFLVLTIMYGQSQRGSLYLLVVFLEHLLLLLMQIVYQVNYAGLEPVDFDTNADAHAVRRAIALFNLASFYKVTVTIFEDGRYRQLDEALARRSRSRA